MIGARGASLSPFLPEAPYIQMLGWWLGRCYGVEASSPSAPRRGPLPTRDERQPDQRAKGHGRYDEEAGRYPVHDAVPAVGGEEDTDGVAGRDEEGEEDAPGLDSNRRRRRSQD